MNKPSLSRKRM